MSCIKKTRRPNKIHHNKSNMSVKSDKLYNRITKHSNRYSYEAIFSLGRTAREKKTQTKMAIVRDSWGDTVQDNLHTIWCDEKVPHNLLVWLWFFLSRLKRLAMGFRSIFLVVNLIFHTLHVTLDQRNAWCDLIFYWIQALALKVLLASSSQINPMSDDFKSVS